MLPGVLLEPVVLQVKLVMRKRFYRRAAAAPLKKG
jgi:hypothetical protein